MKKRLRKRNGAGPGNIYIECTPEFIAKRKRRYARRSLLGPRLYDRGLKWLKTRADVYFYCFVDYYGQRQAVYTAKPKHRGGIPKKVEGVLLNRQRVQKYENFRAFCCNGIDILRGIF